MGIAERWAKYKLGKANRDINALWFYVNRSDCYARQNPKGAGYTCMKVPLTEQLLQAHLDGQITIGVYQLSKDNNVKWGVLDFDENTPEDYAQAEKAYQILKEEGFGVILEKSGGEPLRAHVWVFTPTTILAEQMQAFLTGFCQQHDITPHEIFPKQTCLSEDKPYGNLVKLPLGINLKSGQRSEIVEVANLE